MAMENLEKKFNRTSRIYDSVDYLFERFRYRKLRQRIWRNLTGRILDAGIGTGCNIPFYPDDAEVTGIDMSQGMLEKARKKAERLGRAAQIVKGDVAVLQCPDNYYDAVVATFLCCVVREPDRVARELKRICKPSGQIILLEYVLSKRLIRRLIQKMITPYTRFLFGVDFTQDTLGKLVAAGYDLVHVEDITADILKLIIAKPGKK
ncbi:MAG: methyltransferase domain-containing protein [Sedimentisphaerales bacterium]|nr:methyltransferase domain-containing protein [Sedimentisphaerales bacterium]